jgi:hypothetical protein
MIDVGINDSVERGFPGVRGSLREILTVSGTIS